MQNETLHSWDQGSMAEIGGNRNLQVVIPFIDDAFARLPLPEATVSSSVCAPYYRQLAPSLDYSFGLCSCSKLELWHLCKDGGIDKGLCLLCDYLVESRKILSAVSEINYPTIVKQSNVPC
jgi:hypothetical protein